jgi:peptidoglycan/LPS O-acetylase OafA/YrhL
VLSWTSLVVLALRLSLLDRGLFLWLGERSFGLYMMHMLVVETVDTIWPPQGLSMAALALSQAMILLLALLAAEAAYRLVEVPARRAIRARWAARQAHDPAAGMQPA